MVCTESTRTLFSIFHFLVVNVTYQRDAYETSWHLIIPPVMTLLDDYEARFKLQGVEIVSEMLRRVPKVLLKRTGVDGLIRTVCVTLFS